MDQEADVVGIVPPLSQQQSTRDRRNNRPPPSGHRIPLDGKSPFPDESITGPPPFRDVDGSPVFVGSGIMGDSVHPCKICPARSPACIISYGGQEILHEGRYDLLIIDDELMEWVESVRKDVPPNRKGVEGGYEDHGVRLYHALGSKYGMTIPGKIGVHLPGVHIALNGREHFERGDSPILCWREGAL